MHSKNTSSQPPLPLLHPTYPPTHPPNLQAKRAQIFLTDDALASETATEMSGDSGEADIYAGINWVNKMIPIKDTVKDAMWFL